MDWSSDESGVELDKIGSVSCPLHKDVNVLYINSSDYKLATAHLDQPHSNRVFHKGWQHNMDKMQSSFSAERSRYPLMSAALSACL